MIEEHKFLEWLKNRLLHKHMYSLDDDVIQSINNLQDKLLYKPIQINDVTLDSIISKYYVDFNLDKTEDLNIGYYEKDRIFIRAATRSIIDDVNRTF